MHIEANGEEVRYGLGWWLQVTLDRAKVTDADRWTVAVWWINVWLYLFSVIRGLGQVKDKKGAKIERDMGQADRDVDGRELGRKAGVSKLCRC